MFAVGSAAYQIYNATSRVRSTFSTLSDLSKWVTETLFLQPSEMEQLHPMVRTRLEWLLRRIAVISQPLNFCLLWSQHKGSAVAETVHQCKEVLKQVYGFLAECNKDKSKLADKEYMLRKLEEHIHEIDFCLSSLTLALSIVQSTHSRLPLDGAIGARMGVRRQHSSSDVSPGCLLKASHRICAMHGAGGDVAVCFGQLFVKTFVADSTSQLHAEAEVTVHRPHTKPKWKRLYRRATFKLYKNYFKKSYELRVDCNDFDYDSSDVFLRSVGSKPQSLKFDLTSAIHFTTVPSVLMNLPQFPRVTSASVLGIQGYSDTVFMEDAFAWVEMIANQVRSQFCFVFKSGLEDWNSPPSDDDEANDEDDDDSFVDGAFDDGSVDEFHHSVEIKKKSSSTTSKSRSESSGVVVDFEEDGDSPFLDAMPETQHFVRRTEEDRRHSSEKAARAYLTESMASLDERVAATKEHSHLARVLAPGGDYDESHTTPKHMAYMIRLAVYENDCSRPSVIPQASASDRHRHVGRSGRAVAGGRRGKAHHALDDSLVTSCDEGSDMSCSCNSSEEEDASDEMYGMRRVALDDSTLVAEESGCEFVDGIDSGRSHATRLHRGGAEHREMLDEDLSESQSRELPMGASAHHSAVGMSVFGLGNSSKLPAHLSASDEELNIALRNPPPPPVPFFTFPSKRTEASAMGFSGEGKEDVGKEDDFGSKDASATAPKSSSEVVGSSKLEATASELEVDSTSSAIAEATAETMFRTLETETIVQKTDLSMSDTFRHFSIDDQ